MRISMSWTLMWARGHSTKCELLYTWWHQVPRVSCTSALGRSATKACNLKTCSSARLKDGWLAGGSKCRSSHIQQSSSVSSLVIGAGGECRSGGKVRV
ncbi:uncharacterized protein B0I36DRAFT_10976 [Microdochium trichocladiopsis]|uniref:Uncharacterized protein n=1 Tax=Microdochium trichocladiopsis TaxID=1682393 RepID=A0A9P8YEU2_9PEZI|nr:uncharacterized protein B0I36DRAFT_10976 [Microdochium trichocladiopsis]KAH7040472.1 hypothetical protein B0I36DRAFT_10976 [Microdochium trichocladiopsis]